MELLETPLVRLSGGTITLSSLLLAALVVALGLAFAWLFARAAERLLAARGASESARFAISRLVGYAVALIVSLVAASSIGFNLDALFAASAVLMVGIGFGLQKVAENFIAGLIVLIERPVRKGDFIRVGDAYGWVREVGVRTTRIVTRDEVTIIVPNGELIGSQVINHSVPTARMRVTVSVGVAYGSDTLLVRDVLVRTALQSGLVLDDPPPDVRFDDFGDSSLDFSLLVWIANPAEDRQVASKLRFAIDAAFREAGIHIPFPQRDLHLRSGWPQREP